MQFNLITKKLQVCSLMQLKINIGHVM